MRRGRENKALLFLYLENIQTTNKQHTDNEQITNQTLNRWQHIVTRVYKVFKPCYKKQ